MKKTIKKHQAKKSEMRDMAMTMPKGMKKGKKK